LPTRDAQPREERKSRKIQGRRSAGSTLPLGGDGSRNELLMEKKLIERGKGSLKRVQYCAKPMPSVLEEGENPAIVRHGIE